MKQMRNLICLTMIAMMILSLVVIPVQTAEASSAHRLLRVGDRGADVADVQTMFHSIGVNAGPIDGIFGPQTRNAVIVFQRYNQLTVDGIVGPQTYSALLLHAGRSTSSTRATAATTTASRGGSRVTQNDMHLLAQIISSEAKGEPYEGQVAVGAVVLNRVKSAQFPNTISGVVYERGQFEPVMNGTIHQAPTQSALKAAQDAANGWDPSSGALYFYNPAKSTNRWIFSRPIIKTIGQHVFAR